MSIPSDPPDAATSDPEFLLAEFLPYQLAVAASRVSKEFGTLYTKRFGISVPEWRVVAHLSQVEKASVREIHQRVDMDKSKVSRAASRLTDAGYVSKETDPDDGRLVELRLTPKGQEMMQELAQMAQGFQETLTLRLAGPDGSLDALLKRITPSDRP
jgi:DNA-binding MarR family transcriptional regulator